MAGDDDAYLQHLQQFLGHSAGIFEVGQLPDGTPLRLHHVPPTETKPFHYLITDGMRAYHQPIPDEVEDAPQRVELLMGLHGAWPLTPEHFGDPRVSWPVQLMGALALFPSAESAWFGEGHSIPNGHPPQEYVPGLGLCGALILPVVTLPPEGRTFRDATFLGVVPAYEDELKLKVEQGTEALLERFDRRDINEILMSDRPKVAGGVFDLLA